MATAREVGVRGHFSSDGVHYWGYMESFDATGATVQSATFKSAAQGNLYGGPDVPVTGLVAPEQMAVEIYHDAEGVRCVDDPDTGIQLRETDEPYPFDISMLYGDN